VAANETRQQGFKDMNTQIDAVIQELKDDVAAIGARIDALLQQIANGSVTPEQFADLQAQADALKALGTPGPTGSPP